MSSPAMGIIRKADGPMYPLARGERAEGAGEPGARRPGGCVEAHKAVFKSKWASKGGDEGVGRRRRKQCEQRLEVGLLLRDKHGPVGSI